MEYSTIRYNEVDKSYISTKSNGDTHKFKKLSLLVSVDQLGKFTFHKIGDREVISNLTLNYNKIFCNDLNLKSLLGENLDVFIQIDIDNIDKRVLDDSIKCLTNTGYIDLFISKYCFTTKPKDLYSTNGCIISITGYPVVHCINRSSSFKDGICKSPINLNHHHETSFYSSAIRNDRNNKLYHYGCSSCDQLCTFNQSEMEKFANEVIKVTLFDSNLKVVK